MTEKKILIVDDDRELTSFLAEILGQRDEDCRVSVAYSGEEAMKRFEETSVDVLVTDLRMPGIDGLALMRWVSSFHPETPMILMTGDGQRDVLAQARSSGASKALPKSLDLPALLEKAIGEVLAASSSRSTLPSRSSAASTAE